MKHVYVFLLMIILLFNSNKSTAQIDSIPIHETFILKSKIVQEDRIINVWVPADYKSNVDSLPVLYMADGGIKEDFSHIANTISELINSKKIPPMILVGIENTQRRRDLTGPTAIEEDKKIAPIIGGSEKFRAFINEELFPEINKHYRTTAVKGIIGESLSGLFVVETLLLKPEMFDYYIAFDPSLWWNDHDLVKTAKEHLAHLPNSEKRFWFAASTAKDIYIYTNQLFDILKSEKNTTLKWDYLKERKEKHNTIFRAAKVEALVWTLGKN